MKTVKQIIIVLAGLLATGLQGMNPGVKLITVTSNSGDQESPDSKRAGDTVRQAPIDDPIFDGKWPNVIQDLIRQYAIHPVDYFQAATTKELCMAAQLGVSGMLRNGTMVEKRNRGNTVDIYKLEDGVPAHILFTLKHRDIIRALKIIWGDCVIVYSTDRTIGIWDGLTGQCLQSFVDDSRDDTAAPKTAAYNFKEHEAAANALRNLPQEKLKEIKDFIMQLEVNKHFRRVGDTSGFALSHDAAEFFVSLPKAIQECLGSHYQIVIAESNGCCAIL